MGEPFLDSLALGDFANASSELFLDRPIGGRAPALIELLADRPVVGRFPPEPFLEWLVGRLAALATGLLPRLPTEAIGLAPRLPTEPRLLASMILGLLAPRLGFLATPRFGFFGLCFPVSPSGLPAADAGLLLPDKPAGVPAPFTLLLLVPWSASKR